jgi:hypothetical protein
MSMTVNAYWKKSIRASKCIQMSGFCALMLFVCTGNAKVAAQENSRVVISKAAPKAIPKPVSPVTLTMVDEVLSDTRHASVMSDNALQQKAAYLNGEVNIGTRGKSQRCQRSQRSEGNLRYAS